MGCAADGQPGFSSVTFLYSAAETIGYYGKPTYIYYFGDHDPSGVDISRVVNKDLRGFAPDVPISFERVAVTPEQITDWDLPTRPTKKSDSRSKQFTGDSVDVDAIPPAQLHVLAEQCVGRHIDEERLTTLLLTEQLERKTLVSIAENGWALGEVNP